MLRSSTAQGAFAILLVIASGCASAKNANTGGGDMGTVGGGDGGGGGGDGGGGDDGGGDTPDMRSGTCDVVAQTGCASGEKCELGSMANECVPDGNKATGNICGTMMSDDCVHSNLCIGESATLNQCRQSCATDTDCKQPAAGGVASNTGHCLITLTGSTVKVCTVACQPAPAAPPSGCATGLACQIYGFMSGGLNLQGTDCAAPGAGADGANCATNGNGDCAAGFGCVSVTSGSTTVSKCRRLCRLASGNADCVAGAPTCSAPTGNNPSWGFCCPSGGC